MVIQALLREDTELCVDLYDGSVMEEMRWKIAQILLKSVANLTTQQLTCLLFVPFIIM